MSLVSGAVFCWGNVISFIYFLTLFVLGTADTQCDSSQLNREGTQPYIHTYMHMYPLQTPSPISRLPYILHTAVLVGYPFKPIPILPPDFFPPERFEVFLSSPRCFFFTCSADLFYLGDIIGNVVPTFLRLLVIPRQRERRLRLPQPSDSRVLLCGLTMPAPAAIFKGR